MKFRKEECAFCGGRVAVDATRVHSDFCVDCRRIQPMPKKESVATELRVMFEGQAQVNNSFNR